MYAKNREGKKNSEGPVRQCQSCLYSRGVVVGQKVLCKIRKKKLLIIIATGMNKNRHEKKRGGGGRIFYGNNNLRNVIVVGEKKNV